MKSSLFGRNPAPDPRQYQRTRPGADGAAMRLATGEYGRSEYKRGSRTIRRPLVLGQGGHSGNIQNLFFSLVSYGPTTLTTWKDSDDHSKTFGTSALGFWQWNTNLFWAPGLPGYSIAIFFDDDIYSELDTVSLELLDADENVLASVSQDRATIISATGLALGGDGIISVHYTDSEPSFVGGPISEFNGVRATLAHTGDRETSSGLSLCYVDPDLSALEFDL